MKKFVDHFIDNNNKIFKPIFFSLLFFYCYYAIKLNHYELLFIDERLLIDDIYNVWLLDDVFDRFTNIKNDLIKSILIIITEVSYGGDLRYGRLWSNIFTLLVGPFSLISNNTLISSARILNILIFGGSIYFLSKIFIKKNYHWLAVVSLYSIPGVEFLNRFPKPETLSIFFISIGFYYLNIKKNYFAIFFFSVATFLKVNFVLLLLIVFCFIFYKIKNKFEFAIKSFLIAIFSLIIVNPILLVPPIKIFNFQAPNFYTIYLDWIFSQGTYGQMEIFSIDYTFAWAFTLTKFYGLSSNMSYLFLIFLAILVCFLIRGAMKKNDDYSLLFILIFTIYIIFYFFFIERQFIWYINLPFIFIILAIFRLFENNDWKGRLSFILILFFVVSGLSQNINEHIDEKEFLPNYKYGYEGVVNQEQAIFEVNQVLSEIKEIYDTQDNLNYLIVYWDPKLFIPRNGVTYKDAFFVREHWGSNNIDDILNISDIFVTYENIETKEINIKKVGNYIIYFK